MSSIIDRYGSFVKEQVEFNERCVAQNAGDERRERAYHNRAITFKNLLAELAEISAQPTMDANDESLFRLSPDELDNLPEELLNQLSLTEGDKQEFFIAELIKDLGGATSLDKLLIAIYRRTGTVEKRTRLNSRLYRMANRKMVFAHPSRKGIYGLRPFAAEEAGETQSEFFEEDRQPDDY